MIKLNMGYLKIIKISTFVSRSYCSSTHSFITTPIFYVNAAPHLGHLYSAVISDAAHRYQKLRSPDIHSIFSTGTDEHGLKVQQAAGSNDIKIVKRYCDEISSQYKKLFNLSGINYSRFIRTTDEDHIKAVQHFYNVLNSNGHIYKGKYSGWYCVPDETFLTDKQLLVVEQPDGSKLKVSETSGHPVQWTEEENFLFKLSSFRLDLLHWLKDERRIVPSKFHKILLNWLSDETSTHDISISRPSKRIPWGIPIPGDATQNIYVWLDALVNYLTVAGYPEVQIWPPTTHVVGKDILKFHGIYWPAFLIAAGLEPPRKLFVHSHWMVNGEKMSKSKKNVINPFEKINQYGISGFRYFLLKEGIPHSDGNYTENKIHNMLNADLANTFGNLLNRCSTKTLNAQQVYPAFSRIHFDELYSEFESLQTLVNLLDNLGETVDTHYADFNFYLGIQYILTTLSQNNKFFDDCKPWYMKKNNDQLPKLRCIIHITMETLRISAISFQPIIPDISIKVFTKLNTTNEKRKWKSMRPSWTCEESQIANMDTKLGSEHVILFSKLLDA